jgi:hypothetical protein
VRPRPDIHGLSVCLLGFGNGSQDVKQHAHRWLVDPQALEGNRTNQGVGRDLPVRRIGGYGTLLSLAGAPAGPAAYLLAVACAAHGTCCGC